MDYLASALQYLKGVGPRRAADLQRVGLHTIEDLLYRFPIRYEDRGRFQPIASLRPGNTASIVGEVVSGGIRPTRRPGFRIFELLVRDNTGSIRAIWFNQPFLADIFHPRQRVILFGKIELTSHGVQLQNPQYEVLRQETAGDSGPREPAEDETLHTGRIVPVYEKTGNLTTKMQRVLVHDALAQVPETLSDPIPANVLERLQLVSRRTALQHVHFPPEGRRRRRVEPFQVAGAAPADLRGVLPLSAGADPAQAATPQRNRSRARSASPTRSAIRCAACCRSGSPGTRRR